MPRSKKVSVNSPVGVDPDGLEAFCEAPLGPDDLDWAKDAGKDDKKWQTAVTRAMNKAMSRAIEFCALPGTLAFAQVTIATASGNKDKQVRLDVPSRWLDRKPKVGSHFVLAAFLRATHYILKHQASFHTLASSLTPRRSSFLYACSGDYMIEEVKNSIAAVQPKWNRALLLFGSKAPSLSALPSMSAPIAHGDELFLRAHLDAAENASEWDRPHDDAELVDQGEWSVDGEALHLVKKLNSALAASPADSPGSLSEYLARVQAVAAFGPLLLVAPCSLDIGGGTGHTGLSLIFKAGHKVAPNEVRAACRVACEINKLYSVAVGFRRELHERTQQRAMRTAFTMVRDQVSRAVDNTSEARGSLCVLNWGFHAMASLFDHECTSCEPWKKMGISSSGNDYEPLHATIGRIQGLNTKVWQGFESLNDRCVDLRFVGLLLNVVPGVVQSHKHGARTVGANSIRLTTDAKGYGTLTFELYVRPVFVTRVLETLRSTEPLPDEQPALKFFAALCEGGSRMRLSWGSPQGAREVHTSTVHFPFVLECPREFWKTEEQTVQPAQGHERAVLRVACERIHVFNHNGAIV